MQTCYTTCTDKLIKYGFDALLMSIEILLNAAKSNLTWIILPFPILALPAKMHLEVRTMIISISSDSYFKNYFMAIGSTTTQTY